MDTKPIKGPDMSIPSLDVEKLMNWIIWGDDANKAPKFGKIIRPTNELENF